MGRADRYPDAMTTHPPTNATDSEPTRPFYLPALPSVSGGRLERLLTSIHARPRRLLRQRE